MAISRVLAQVVLVDGRFALDAKPAGRAMARRTVRHLELVVFRFESECGPEICGTRYYNISNALGTILPIDLLKLKKTLTYQSE